MKYIFDPTNYYFEEREGNPGLSGQLYNAFRFGNRRDQWVVKMHSVEDVVNEFVISVIGNELGILVPECKITILEGKLALFSKYIPNLKFLNKSEIENCEIMQDYLKQVFLADVFRNDDDREIYIDDKKQVWQLDNAMGGFDVEGYAHISKASKINEILHDSLSHIMQSQNEYAEESVRETTNNLLTNELGQIVAFELLNKLYSLYANFNENENLSQMFDAISELAGKDEAALYYAYLRGIFIGAHNIFVDWYEIIRNVSED